MTTRRPRVLLVTVAVGLLATACSATTTGTAVPAGGAAAITPGAATGAVPAGLEQFYAQAAEWGPCADYALTPTDAEAYADPALECARVTVPLDYADPDGETATVALLRVPASGAAIGSLLVNPGGPGGSGMSLAVGLAGAVAGTELGERFDLVGFDPRGIGASTPAVDCTTDAEADAERAELDVDVSAAGIAETEAEAAAFAERCAERVGAGVLAHVGTVEVVQDMDVLRSVLGDEQLSYLGFSYGTRLGSSYAERFPGNVRALVLDGALDPTATPTEELVGQAEGFQSAFDAYATDCASTPTCPLGTDPAGAVAAYRALVDPLIEAAAPTAQGRELSYDDAITGTIQALYSPELWPALTGGLAELQAGRGDTLLLLADLYSGRQPDGSYSNQDDAFTAVRCVDDPPVTDRAEVNAVDTAYRAAAPFLDDGLGTGMAPLDVCAFWPVDNSGTPHTPEVDGLPQTLVVSTTGDPATPYQAGVDLAAQLGARLLTFTGDQHTVALGGVACVDDIVTRYLIDLELPAADATC